MIGWQQFVLDVREETGLFVIGVVKDARVVGEVLQQHGDPAVAEEAVGVGFLRAHARPLRVVGKPAGKIGDLCRGIPETLHRPHVREGFGQRDAGDSLTGSVQPEHDERFGNAGDTALGAEVGRVGQLDQACGQRHVAADDLVQLTEVGFGTVHLLGNAFQDQGAGRDTIVPQRGLKFPVEGRVAIVG